MSICVLIERLLCVSGADRREAGEHPTAAGPPGPRRAHREAEGGDRPAEQGELPPGFIRFCTRQDNVLISSWERILKYFI